MCMDPPWSDGVAAGRGGQRAHLHSTCTAVVSMAYGRERSVLALSFVVRGDTCFVVQWTALLCFVVQWTASLQVIPWRQRRAGRLCA